ncbi:MAG: hypothetical protein V4621_03245 [Pseudomonadota bacterium]
MTLDNSSENTATPLPVKGDGGRVVLLKDEIEIYPDRPLKGLLPEGVPVFAAKSRRGPNAYAVLCDKYIVPRLEYLTKYSNITHAGASRLLNMGVVEWPGDNTQRFVMVYEQGLTRPLAASEESIALGWSPDAVRSLVNRYLLPVLRELHTLQIPFGHLRLTNIFVGTPPNEPLQPTTIDRMMLGDCLCLPHGYHQPAIYEPIERVLTDPLGRGEGSLSDDMYALGVCLGLMVRTEDPNHGVSAREVFLRKVELGSFSAIMGKSRVTGTLLELLRGLLLDDPKLRWTLDDVALWTDGRRVTPKSNPPSKAKAARPLEFAGQSITRPVLLSVAMTENVIEAVKLIESKELQSWIVRSLEDKALSKQVDEAVVAAREHGTGGNYADRLVTHVAMLLAPNLPITYRGLTFLPDAFGRMLVYYYGRGAHLNSFADVIRYRMIEIWIGNAPHIGFDAVLLDQRLTACRNSLKQVTVGYGLERCVYILVPEAPCLSETFPRHYLFTSDDIIIALEDSLSRHQKIETPFDRHVAAFLSMHDPVTTDPHLYELNSTEPHRRLEAMLQILRKLQIRHRSMGFPMVTTWLGDLLQPLADRFHDRSLRAGMRTTINKLKGGGEIASLALLLNDPHNKKRDMTEFAAAMHEYRAISQEYVRLSVGLERNKKYGYDKGREVSAAISALLSFVIILLVMFSTYFGKGL